MDKRQAMIEEARKWMREHGIDGNDIRMGDIVDFALEMLGDQEPATTEVRRDVRSS